MYNRNDYLCFNSGKFIHAEHREGMKACFFSNIIYWQAFWILPDKETFSFPEMKSGFLIRNLHHDKKFSGREASLPEKQCWSLWIQREINLWKQMIPGFWNDMNSKNSFFLLLESYTSLEKERGFYPKMDSPVKHRDFFSKPFLSNWELDRGLEIR